MAPKSSFWTNRPTAWTRLRAKRLIELIREIREASDICLLLSSHLLRDVEETCDEVLILRNGKIASICNLVEERRANRKFLELETIGAEATFTSCAREHRLRVRGFHQRSHQGRYAGHASKSARSSKSLRIAACRFAA